MALIIVESPTKARTFNRILKGKNFYVFATLGHIRDLPSAKLSIDYSHDFKPTYQILKGREKIIAQLKKFAEKNDEIILASDPDREGESIAYHAAYILGFINESWPNFKVKNSPASGKQLKRIVFHEITSQALSAALKEPEDLRQHLIQAQQTRRILDRVVGYELSPLLWQKMGKNWLSAGRVQTIALRLIVERENEIKNFKQDEYFQINAKFLDGSELAAKLIELAGEKVEKQYKVDLFDGEYRYTKTEIIKANVGELEAALKKASYEISDIISENVKRYPPPPFTTSLLQQDAFYKFGFPSKMTMRLAQNLYERGLITYHRTDSFNLATHFVFKAKDYIAENFGKEYALEKPRGYKTKSKLAQEAHEAIRPTNIERNSAEIQKKYKLTTNHKKIYELIYRRALATQMKEAEIQQTKALVLGDQKYLFESELQKVLFDGFLKVLNPEYSKKHEADLNLKKGEKLKLIELEPKETLTQPPPRYNEASLIRTLEEKGIGRPSTYSPIISLIQEKLYVDKENRHFKPTNLGEAISNYLSASFSKLFDLNFTASMEDGLDEIAEGKKDLVKLLAEFYEPFKKELELRKSDKEKIKVEDEDHGPCPKCGKNLTIRYSKFGKFLACSGYPKCKFTKSILKELPGKKCPNCGNVIVVRYSKKGKRFYGCSTYPDCKFTAFALNEI